MDAGIDPVSRDLSGKRIDTLANAVYLRLSVPLGSWFGAPALGSRLHELQRQKDLSRVAVLARQYAGQALQPLIADGRALAVAVDSRPDGKSRLRLIVTVTDAGGRRQVFEHFVSVI